MQLFERQDDIIVYGDTFNHKYQLKTIGGEYANSVEVNGNKVRGWIINKKRRDILDEYIKTIKLIEAVHEEDVMAQPFKIGDNVYFDYDGNKISGKVTKINKINATVTLSDGLKVTVAKVMLKK